VTIASRLMSLQEIVAARYSFQVPIYQRLYVWGEEQVKTLLEDLLMAYHEQKDIFYLGGTLLVERRRGGTGRCFDVIDGQQRLTTLWMMSVVWQQELKPFLHRKERGISSNRITFPIRNEVDKFFENRIAGASTTAIDNKQIIDALALIKSFFQDEARGVSVKSFTRFVYRNVKMVLTRVPEHTDLNKLFEVINDRGQQLQHQDILKARLLRFITDPRERQRYAQMWDACSCMGGYVEKNLKDITGLKVAELFNNRASRRDEERLAKATEVLHALSQRQIESTGTKTRTLRAILQARSDEEHDSETADDVERYEADDVRSIIGFPLLLQHTLRIWLQAYDKPDLPKILDKQLLSLFHKHFLRNATHAHVTSFIELLWEIRYCFDKYVIKWSRQDQHVVCKLRLSPTTSRGKTYYSLVRDEPESTEGFTLLQGMLYHSQQLTTHYWLTPLLAYIHRHPGCDHFAFLRHLDNHLLCTNTDKLLPERTHDFLRTPWQKNTLDYSLLLEPKGTVFPHYWFYKLEFILWDRRRVAMKDPRWENFRITAKNSIEHISPQMPQVVDTNQVSDDQRDRFGNLGLVTQSINSEYSNRPFNEKRQRFHNLNAVRLDSLKMALIYRHDRWSDALAAAHEKDMIDLISDYLGTDFSSGNA